MTNVVTDWEAVRNTVARIHLRYAQEVVEALGMCPWAQSAREAGRVRTLPHFGRTPDLEATLALLSSIEAQPEVEVALLVFPELDLDRLAFSRFVAEVRAADEARKPIGKTILAMADFHPNAEADMLAPERLVPFIRRTPDPTLQAIRRTALEGVRFTENQGTAFVDVAQISLSTLQAAAPTPALAARIARHNWKTIESLGVEHLETIFRDILRDRHASYSARGLAQPARAK